MHGISSPLKLMVSKPMEPMMKRRGTNNVGLHQDTVRNTVIGVERYRIVLTFYNMARLLSLIAVRSQAFVIRKKKVNP